MLAACGDSSSTTPPPPPPIDPGELPRLAPGTRVGVVYAEPAPAAMPVLDAAFLEAIAAGMDTYQLGLTWDALELAPFDVDVALLDALLGALDGLALAPYLGVATVNTVRLELPADFVSPQDAGSLAPGITFDDAALLARYEAVLDEVVPRLVASGGFLLALGNEVDVWLGLHPDQRAAYLAFLAAARAHVRTLDARLAVGVSVTSGVLANDPGLFAELDAATDVVAFTYYPLANDFSVEDPSVVAADLAEMVAAVAPYPLVLQEVGYPAGYTAGPGNGSSAERQRQFVENVFATLRAEPRIRFASFFHLADWSPGEVDTFVQYYGVNDPLFREYLATLGLREHVDGAPKAAWAELVAGLQAR